MVRRRKPERVRVEVFGVEKLRRQLKEARKDLRDVIDKELDPSMRRIRDGARRRLEEIAEELTPELSISYQIHRTKQAGAVYTEVEHAPHVELGIRRHRGSRRRHLGPAFDEEKPKFIENVTRNSNRALRRRART